ncbi:MAG: putative ABC transporter ATP-binding protein [Alphaproteobacteria bacterium MarineAlpha3_Bin7]|nr:MAG: putative ABC transporter ATP-binding protein [Alphaproteobacteria bacterium MarineAlpha3_Bin7]|tara:strand:- start:1447 stop:2136 length:690 start_codon:yes stop_codon:yes gene_type:complete
MAEKKPDNNIVLENVHLNLNTSAGRINILRGISLKIKSGESVAVIGPSGGGKTTLIMAIAGLEKISSGSLRVAGVETSELGEDDLAMLRRKNFGIVFQDFHLIPTMTALENVAIPLELAGASSDVAFSVSRNQLKSVGLGHRFDHYPSQLSGGEQQRVAIARAYASKPGILLADEPTGNLDGETGMKIMDLLFELHKDNETTMVLISHDNELADRCGRTITLADGKIKE